MVVGVQGVDGQQSQRQNQAEGLYQEGWAVQGGGAVPGGRAVPGRGGTVPGGGVPGGEAVPGVGAVPCRWAVTGGSGDFFLHFYLVRGLVCVCRYFKFYIMQIIYNLLL